MRLLLRLRPTIPSPAGSLRVMSSLILSPDQKRSRDINKRLVDQKKGDWRGVLSIYSNERSGFNGVNLATVVSKLGRVQSRDYAAAVVQHPSFRALLTDLEQVMAAPPGPKHFGSAREVGTVVHGLARLGVPRTRIAKILEAVEGNSRWLVATGSPQCVANTAWAFAKLGVPAPALFGNISERASTLVKSGNAQAVSNTAWAFATLNVPPLESLGLFKMIDEHASALVKNGNPQTVSNTAWAFASLSIPAPALCGQIEEAAAELVERGNPLSIANTAWALMKMKWDAPQFFEAVNSRCEYLIKEGNAQNLANTAMAFADVGANADMRGEAFFACLQSAAESRRDFLETADAQNICLVCWSLVILDLARRNEPLLQLLWKRASEMELSRFSNSGITQLAQVEIHARASGVELIAEVSLEMRSRFDEIPTFQESSSSPFAMEYSSLLADIGFDNDREVSPAEGLNFMLIDIACVKSKIGIECDGPFHYLLNSGRETGSSRAKKRLLERLGWKVISIPYWVNEEFMERGGDKRIHLREFLEGKGVAVESCAS
jgi:hypothetical protein